MKLSDYVDDRRRRIDRALDRLLPPSEGPASTIAEAMRYAVLGGGKRLRPILVVASHEACGGSDEAILEPAHDRITWDAEIHGIADIEALPWVPRMVNVKPSRIGGLRELCDTYDYCAERGIRMYGGGQFELGVGRGQIQYLASLFHADTPNDTAPVGFNEVEPPAGLPSRRPK